MKHLSKWAKTHRIAARWIIAFCHILVVINAIWLGILFFQADWALSEHLLPTTALLFVIAYFLYPKKGRNDIWFRHTYFRQKTHDFILVLTYGLVIAMGVNNFLAEPEKPLSFTQHIQTSQILLATTTTESNATLDIPENHFSKATFRKFKKQIRQELKTLKKELKKEGKNNLTTADKVLLILLTLGLAILLGFLVAILACNIACSGNEGAAWVIIITGWAGIIFLGIISIRAIVRTYA